ncbi:MAG: SCO family protein [Candidatus Thiodiazotropha sp. (ex Lucinoma kastoroae)]|nr:SCO family protein [Candidatus Thiodiazotropha sp. (ex Lucinoma kastoroae)]MCU7858495.1 SCO family protein [Candidatus Thiodiazotropha sp. (ex Lucinoma kastoroae)]
MMSLDSRNMCAGLFILPAMVFSLATYSSEGEISDAPGIETGTFQPPFKMDCITRPSNDMTTANRFMVSTNMSDHSNHDQHAHHRMMMEQNDYKIDKVDYSIPDVFLTSHKGEKTHLPQLLNSDKPVMLNFIFTTCTTICPVLSASFHQVQEILGKDESVSMISITIDPEYDTPQQLMKYARRFKAQDNWQFFTGSYKDVVSVEKAFDIFRGSKLNHEPITLIRGDADASWIRINGLASAEDIVKEYQSILDNEE